MKTNKTNTTKTTKTTIAKSAKKKPAAVLSGLATDMSAENFKPAKSAKKKTALSADLEAGKILAAANMEAAAPEQLAEATKPAKQLSKRDLKSLAKKAAIEAAALKPLPDEKPATKKKAKSAPKSAKKKASDDGALAIHLYGAGKVFLFSKSAAERLAGMPNMSVEISGKKLTLTPTKSEKDTTPITTHQNRPILRAGKILKSVEWSGKTQSLIAKAIGERGFEITIN